MDGIGASIYKHRCMCQGILEGHPIFGYSAITYVEYFNQAGPAPQRVVLPNGIRLILKENPRLPKVSVVCVFPGGLMAETKENNGISNLTSALLLKGTKKRNEHQIKPVWNLHGIFKR